MTDNSIHAPNAGSPPAYTSEQEIKFFRYNFFLRDRNREIPITAESDPAPWGSLAGQHGFLIQLPLWVRTTSVLVNRVSTVVVIPTAISSTVPVREPVAATTHVPM
ncbi:hypothetical protein FIBSPDRAFT_964976 [Athelia psychrophila]|uniref:Uncharacterized protein n=1 Tax=Athelia psychrophila TaxID=1759441 RepID=A0A165X617_9AGAM|nr:hypothetical protein FIBSPDRAFT_964976 [Fibularhizoctonia sp. CBS 109695]